MQVLVGAVDVVFVDGMGNNFWDVVTCKKFRHCYAFRWDGYNWIVVDALSQSLEVHILPFGQEVDLPKETTPEELKKFEEDIIRINQRFLNKMVSYK